MMSILLYAYKELTECISEVERIEAKVNRRRKKKRVVDSEKERRTKGDRDTTRKERRRYSRDVDWDKLIDSCLGPKKRRRQGDKIIINLE